MMIHLVKLLTQTFLAAQLKYDCPDVQNLSSFQHDRWCNCSEINVNYN